MEQHHGAVVDPGQKLGKCLFPGGLGVVVPVGIGKTPKNRPVAEALGGFQVGFAVSALGRALKFFHFLAGDGGVEVF